MIYDFIIIGSGPGGAVFAERASQTNAKVLILEFGDLKLADDFSLKEMQSNYMRGGFSFTVGKPRIKFVEGKAIGGGGEINSGLYHRTPNIVLKDWLDFDMNEFVNNSNLYFEEIEREMKIQLWPNDIKMPEASILLHNAAKLKLWNSIEVPRWFNFQDGFKRFSTYEAYIKPYLINGGNLISNTFVKKINKINNDFIVYTNNGEFKTKKIVISAGCFNSYSLVNKNFSIQSKKTFTLHPTIKVLAQFNDPIDKSASVGIHQVKEFSPKITLGCSASDNWQVSLNRKLFSIQLLEKDIEKCAIYYAMLSTNTRGNVFNIPFLNDALQTFNLIQEDFENLRQGMINLGQLLFSAGAKHLFLLGNSSDSISVSSLDEFLEKMKKIDMLFFDFMSIHVMSSLAIGTFVDSAGNLMDEENVIICDSSVLPGSPTVNPQGTIMAIAKHIADKNIN